MKNEAKLKGSSTTKVLKFQTLFSFCSQMYSKTCLKQQLKTRQNKDLMTNGSLKKVESIAECSPWSILQFF